jgi:hypothetical protein
MKTIALTLFAAALGFAQVKPPTGIVPVPKAKTTAAPPAAKAKPQPPKSHAPKPAPDPKAMAPAQSIPAGAKLVEPNLYRYTDSNGKTWNYRQTPFGISKWEETSPAGSEPVSQPAPQSKQAKSDPVVVTDLGDSYRFDKKTPFGHSSWTRKKSELTDEEKTIAETQRAPSNPNRNSVNSKAAGTQ